MTTAIPFCCLMKFFLVRPQGLHHCSFWIYLFIYFMYEEFIHGKAMLNLNNYKLLKANSLFKDEIKDEHLLFLNLDAHGVRRLTRKSLRVNVSKSKPPSVNCGQCCQEKWSPDCEEDVWKWLKLPVTIQKIHRKCLYFMSFETIFKRKVKSKSRVYRCD